MTKLCDDLYAIVEMESHLETDPRYADFIWLINHPWLGFPPFNLFKNIQW